MSYSRRQLYALGEPLGDSATRAKPSGGYVCGGGGSSKSSQATTNNDNRVAVQDGVGFSASNGNWLQSNSTTNTTTNWVTETTNHTTLTNNITDGGLVSRGLDSVDSALRGMLGVTEGVYSSALDAVNVSQSKTADGFAKLLGATEGIYGSALDAVNLSQANNADGFSKLLGFASDMFTSSQSLVGQTQKSVADAYSMAQADAKGTIDNRTIMVIAVAGIAAMAFAKGK